MANVELSFRSQIFCGRYFNFPGTLMQTVGWWAHCVYTHIQYSNLLLWFHDVPCILSERKEEIPQQDHSATAKLPTSRRKQFFVQQRQKWRWYSTCTAVKRCKVNASFFSNWTSWITACRGAFTGPQLRKDWQGGRLSGLRLGPRVVVCLPFHWNSSRHKRLIPSRNTEDDQVMGPGLL